MDVTPTINQLHGRILTALGPDPAAGAEIDHDVPARRRWKLLSIYFSLTTDVNVADRTILLRIIGPSGTVYQLSTSTVQPASETHYYVWTNSSQAELVVGTNHIMPLPPLIIPAAYSIDTITTNIQAGDNYAAPRFLIEEWIDP